MNSAVAYNQKFQIFPSQNDSNIKFPKNNLERPQNRDSLKTFSTVLDQALTTKDKNSIKEILINQDQEIIVNTISNLSLKCILPLLEHIQILLLQDHSNAIKYLSWLAQTVKIHLGIIVNSIESRNKLKSIKKIINERLSNENKIMMMYGKLPLQTKKTRQNKQFKPKFHYIEEEQDADEYHEGEQQKQAYFNEQQELDFEDFDEMDQFI